MIDVARRLRRAIHLNDLALVQRIVRNSPHALQNPDFEDKSNTSLHLAAKHGFLEIAIFLVESGHENAGISKNEDWDTPLTLAAQYKQIDVGLYLIQRFHRCVPWSNKAGMDVLMTCCRAGATDLLTPLLTCPTPASISAFDRDGNTALHHASAAGELKAVRVLLYAGASPIALNAYSWTPIAYSATASAELYLKSIISDLEQQKRKESSIAAERRERPRPPAGGAVRLVTSEDVVGGHVGREEDSLSANSMRRGSYWSPVVQRRAMTPTVGGDERDENWPLVGNRLRASSGD